MSDAKRCGRCGVTLHRSLFAKHSRNRDRLQQWCRDCATEHRRMLRTVDYDAMLEAQGGRCGICKTEACKSRQRFAVDHCHTTGRIRGLLCVDCNTGLGKLRDGRLFEAALAYLKRSEA